MGDIYFNLIINSDISETYTNKPWDWAEISCNPNITMQIIE